MDGRKRRNKGKKKRKRRGYVRPSRAAAKAGWSLIQLSRLSGSSVRAIRLYLQREVLPRPPFLGAATRYQRQHLATLLAIRRLLAEGLPLDAIRTRLEALSRPELDAFAAEGLAPGPLADALGVVPVAARTPGIDPAALDQRASLLAPRWARIELALGLELHVRDDAAPGVRELARRMRELCEEQTSS